MTSPGGDAKICPSQEVLAQTARGAADATTEAAVQDHLNQCTRCREEFRKLLSSVEDTVELREAAEADGEAELEAIRAAGARRRSEVEARGEEVLFDDGLRLPAPRDREYVARLGGYDVASVVGRGGMGVVLEAFDQDLQRRVALKVMKPAFLEEPAAKERFFAEAVSTAALKHPNIVTIHSVRRDEDPPFLVMEYVAGKPLSLLIAEQGSLTVGRALDVSRQLLEAAGHAHQRGVIHRDIKPSNVLIEEESELVKLVDFGLARAVTDTVRRTAEGSVVGTPWYMSPEQAAGAHPLDARSDLYSIGVILFEMLVGVVPFPGPDKHLVMERIRRERAPDACELNAAIPRPLGDIVGRALQTDSAVRFQSAKEFADCIDKFSSQLGQETQTVRSPPSAGPSKPLATAGSGADRCAACSKTILSALSVAGECEVCGEPICAACWRARGVRRCAKHAGAGPDSADSGGEKASDSARREARPPGGTSEREKRLQQDAPSREPVAAAIPPARASSPAAGRPAVTVAEAQVARDTFFRVLDHSLRSLEEVVDPLRGAAIPVPDWSTVVRRERNPRQGGAKDAAAEGLSARVIYDLRKPALVAQPARVVIEGRCLVRTDRFAGAGEDDQPFSRLEVESLLNESARRAAEEDTWRLVVLASPTGWEEDVRRFVAAGGFRDRFLAAALFDRETGGLLCPETDERLKPFVAAFSADGGARLRRQVVEFLKVHFEHSQSVSLDTVADQLGIDRQSALKICRRLAESDKVELHEFDDLGFVLTRR